MSFYAKSIFVSVMSKAYFVREERLGLRQFLQSESGIFFFLTFMELDCREEKSASKYSVGKDERKNEASGKGKDLIMRL